MRLGDIRARASVGPKGADAGLEARLGCFNATTRPYPRDSSISAVFRTLAASQPDAPAVLGETRDYSYGMVDAWSDRVAAWLVDKGIQPEEAVAVLIDTGFALAIALLGILKAGGAYLPLEPSSPLSRGSLLVADARVRFLLADPICMPMAERLQSECDALMAVLCVDDAAPLPTSNSLPALPSPGPTSLAYIIYTSGTTGRPKGVMVEHRAVLRLSVDPDYVRLGRDTRILQTGAVAFDASTFEIWGALLNGGALMRPGKAVLLDPKSLRALIAARGIDVMWLTASLFNQLVALDPNVLAGLRSLLVGGERLSPYHIGLLRAANPRIEIINGYGPTESTTFATHFASIGISSPTFLSGAQSATPPSPSSGKAMRSFPSVSREKF